VAAGRFRADLFYRLHVLPIHLPPLRDRPEDILPLAEAFLAGYAAEEYRSFTGFDDDATRLLGKHAWPGNVRELANTIRRIVVLADDTVVRAEMLPESIRPKSRLAAPEWAVSPAPAAITPYHIAERRLIEAAIASCNGNVPRAAAALEISPSTIYRKLQTWLPEGAQSG
jgi:two-component system repressor protein LuxO